MTFNISLIPMKKKQREALRSPFIIQPFGAGANPDISLSSALGSWFPDTARGLLIFKSRNLDQRQHLNSKRTGFAARLSTWIRESVSKGRLGARAAPRPGRCETLQLCQQQRPAPGHPPKGEHSQAAENTSDKQLLLLETQRCTQQQPACSGGVLRGSLDFCCQGLRKERFTLFLLSELTFYMLLACKTIAVCKAAAFS